MIRVITRLWKWGGRGLEILERAKSGYAVIETHTHPPPHTHTPTLVCLWLQSGTPLFYTCLHTMKMGTPGWPLKTPVDPSWPVNYHRVQTFYRATGDKWGALTHSIAPVILYTALTRNWGYPRLVACPQFMGKNRNIPPIEAKNQRTHTRPHTLYLPVPPPNMVVSPDATASLASCGQMKWIWASSPPAVNIMPSPAMASVPTATTIPGVTPSITSGLPALPMPTIKPFYTKKQEKWMWSLSSI